MVLVMVLLQLVVVGVGVVVGGVEVVLDDQENVGDHGDQPWPAGRECPAGPAGNIKSVFWEWHLQRATRQGHSQSTSFSIIPQNIVPGAYPPDTALKTLC